MVLHAACKNSLVWQMHGGSSRLSYSNIFMTCIKFALSIANLFIRQCMFGIVPGCYNNKIIFVGLMSNENLNLVLPPVHC